MRARSETNYDYEQQADGSPELINELLETNGEWTNIQDIVKLTFKGIY